MPIHLLRHGVHRSESIWASRTRNFSKEILLKNERKIIFSGIQPTGIPHLGNYLGALRRWTLLQNTSTPSSKLIFSIVDLHAITIRQEPDQLRRWKRETLAVLLASGVDPERCTVFYQSDVPQHTELMWILSCSANMGYLSRMTQWKAKTMTGTGSAPSDQSAFSTQSPLRLGLFSYPVLQAADILVHGATHVPVGQDQAQHLEFARELAHSFNHAVSTPNLLTEPITLLSAAKKIMSLRQPGLKMSKSHADPRSRILITDGVEVIRSKIAGAVTDSLGPVTWDPQARPGVANLLGIVAHLRSHTNPLVSGEGVTPEEIGVEMHGLCMKELKDKVTDEVEKGIGSVREAYETLIKRESYLEEVAIEGGRKARESAEETLGRVREASGLR